MRARGYFWERPHPGRWIILATLLDLGVVTLLATQGWLMAPIPPSLIGALLLLAIAFLVVADLLTVMVVGTTPEDERDLGVEGGGSRS
jgi:H+-transporting ATPase